MVNFKDSTNKEGCVRAASVISGQSGHLSGWEHPDTQANFTG
jgi:hypothetical protein